MNSLKSLISVVISILTLLQNIEEGFGKTDRYICKESEDPLGEVTTSTSIECCEAKEYDNFFAASYFPCSSEGGCCGVRDSQYCCDTDRSTQALDPLPLGLGITAGALVLLALIFLLLYCVHKRVDKKEIICTGFCSCEAVSVENREDWERDRERDRRLEIIMETINRDVSREEHRSTIHIQANRERPPESYRTASRTPTAPTVTSGQDTLSPPSYNEVVSNLPLYPKTNQ